MSSIRVNQITDAAGGNSAVLNGVVNAPGGMNFRNRILNGDFRIDQRNNGASVTAGATFAYSLDRWQYGASQASKFTIQQNAGGVTPPAGFTNYLGVTSSSAYSLAAGDYFLIQQPIEGFNFADLAWGTASAQAVTLSFRVYSSLAGTFGGILKNSASNRTYPFTYSVAAANTWTNITINIPGDTTGTWVINNGNGCYVTFGLGVGSAYSGTPGAWSGSNFISATGATSVVGTSGATWAVTGVQLEAGTVATPFERVDFGTQLIRCQRYFRAATVSAISFGAFGAFYLNRTFDTPMRASPTISFTGSWTTATPIPQVVSPSGFYWSSGSAQFYSNATATETASAEL